MSLDSYKVDSAFTKGVVITLEKAPDVEFLVKLPSRYNRGYTQAIYDGVSFQLESGNVVPTGNLVEMSFRQKDAFVAHCIVSMDRKPVPAGFADDYQDAVSELYDKAMQLANAMEEKVTASVKKLSASSNGAGSGQAEKSYTENLSSAAK